MRKTTQIPIYQSPDKLFNKHVIILLILSMIVICAMTSSAITATKPISFGLIFPFSNIVFALFTFPIIDAVCELYGKRKAYFISTLGVISQVFFVLIVELSIITPHAAQWQDQNAYAYILSKGHLVILGTVIGFIISQFLDIFIFQTIKDISKGRFLWLRSGFSSILGQFIDSVIFISIVFWSFPYKTKLILGSFGSKAVFCIIAIPITYLIVYLARYYLVPERK